MHSVLILVGDGNEIRETVSFYSLGDIILLDASQKLLELKIGLLKATLSPLEIFNLNVVSSRLGNQQGGL